MTFKQYSELKTSKLDDSFEADAAVADDAFSPVNEQVLLAGETVAPAPANNGPYGGMSNSMVERVEQRRRREAG